MTKKTVCLVLLMYLTIHSVFSQQSLTYTSQFVDYQKALTLYNNSQFLAAQSVFNQVKSKTSDEVLQSDCAYYIANCAVRLNQKNADDLIQGFVEEYPTSTKRNTAFIDVADYYFENNKFAQSRKWYNKVDENSLARPEKEKFNFNT